MSIKMIKNRLNFFSHLFLLWLQLCDSRKYDNYTLFRSVPIDEKHLEYFKNLSLYDVNFWRLPDQLNMPVEFIVKPEDRRKFQLEADKKGIYLTTVLSDIQSAFEKQTVKTYIRRNLDSFNWQSYFRLKDIYGWLRDLRKTYPNEMKLINIGNTTESRNILAVQITLKGCLFRSKVIIEGGIHAREWISPAFVTYMIQEILKAPTSRDSNLKRIARTYEWIFLPIVNPDGYEYSHTNDRLWRKNRKYPHGVDLNRNFNIAFAKTGVSHKKTSQIYCGPAPFSEEETVAVSNFLKANSEKIEYYISFHSYGQYMIIPYEDSTGHYDNYEEVKIMGLNAAKSISKRYNTKYSVGTAYDTVGYKTSGASTGWVKRNFGVPYAMTFELRDEGEYGFALPPHLILPTCKETMDGLITFLKPRSQYYKSMHLPMSDDGRRTHMDVIVFMFNTLWFIIVRFD